MKGLPFLLAALLLTLAAHPRPAAGAEPKAPKWWNSEWKFRKAVRIDFQPQGNDLPVSFFEPSKLLGERPLTGKAVVATDGDGGEGGRDIVVTDSAGAVVPSRAYASGWERSVTVLFRAEPRSATYYVYYGNPKAKPSPMTWRRSAYPITMVTVPVPDATAIERPGPAAKAVLAAKDERGKIGTYSVNNPVNPFGLEPGQSYITLYSGMLYVGVTGTYEMALEAGGTAHLLLDGSLVLTVRGGDEPGQAWSKKAPVKLGKGLHNFTILHGERIGAQGIRIGWAQPGERRISPMTGSAFAMSSYAPADVVGFEELGREVTAFFTVDAGDVAFRLPNGKAMVPVKVTNRTRGEGLTFLWKVGSQTYTEPSPQCFVEAGNQYDITLEVSRGERVLGKCVQAVNFRAVRHVRAEVGFELVRCPNVIYSGEGAKLSFKVSNQSEYPMPLRWERAAGKDRPASRDMELVAGGEESLEAELPTPGEGESSVVATVRLLLAGTKQGEQSVRVARVGPDIAAYRPKLGHLVDGDGRRVVVWTAREDMTEHERWAAIKWLGEKFEASPKKILLFGDAMMNLSEEPGARGYVEILTRRLEAAGRSMTFAPAVDDAVAPCVADLPAFAAALAKHQPDLVIISPGSRDAGKGVERQELARAVDVCIDLARMQKARVVLVSPPPLVSNPKLSGELADAVGVIASQHGVPFVDLHALVLGEKDWKKLYKQDADDEVYYLYPGLETHEAFAEAILKAVK